MALPNYIEKERRHRKWVHEARTGELKTLDFPADKAPEVLFDKSKHPKCDCETPILMYEPKEIGKSRINQNGFQIIIACMLCQTKGTSAVSWDAIGKEIIVQTFVKYFQANPNRTHAQTPQLSPAERLLSELGRGVSERAALYQRANVTESVGNTAWHWLVRNNKVEKTGAKGKTGASLWRAVRTGQRSSSCEIATPTYV